MQIAANTLNAVINFYKKELAGIYSESELKNIIRWVLEKQLKISAAQIHSDPGMRINESDMTPLEKMCLELKANRPIQYVLGEAEFYGLKFKVDESVLIPRPETEELVERVIKDLTSSLVPHSPHLVLDMGTGSGCIPISIKKNIPSATVFGLDVGGKTLETAKHNADLNHVSVRFFEADILKDDADRIISSQTGEQKIGTIISNPPYVLNAEKKTLHIRVHDFEPHLALFVNHEDPILFYRKIAMLAQKQLKKGGKLWFECHFEQARNVAKMLHENDFKNVVLHNDIAGLQRFAEATWV